MNRPEGIEFVARYDWSGRPWHEDEQLKIQYESAKWHIYRIPSLHILVAQHSPFTSSSAIDPIVTTDDKSVFAIEVITTLIVERMNKLAAEYAAQEGESQ